jgi:hypothetical protein
MPRPVRRRVSPAEVNRHLQSPAFAGLSGAQRRAVRSVLVVLNDQALPPLSHSSDD